MHALWIIVAVVAGALLPVQAAMNARAAGSLGSSAGASLFNFLIGLAVLTAVCVVGRVPIPDGAAVRAMPWWAWVGGVIGAGFVGSALYLSPRLGVVVFLAAITLGQLAASVLIDQFGWLGMPVRAMTPGRWAGVGLVLAGVACVRFL